MAGVVSGKVAGWQLHTCRQRSQDVGNDNERGRMPFGQSAVLGRRGGGGRWQVAGGRGQGAAGNVARALMWACGSNDASVTRQS